VRLVRVCLGVQSEGNARCQAQRVTGKAQVNSVTLLPKEGGQSPRKGQGKRNQIDAHGGKSGELRDRRLDNWSPIIELGWGEKQRGIKGAGLP